MLMWRKEAQRKVYVATPRCQTYGWFYSIYIFLLLTFNKVQIFAVPKFDLLGSNSRHTDRQTAFSTIDIYRSGRGATGNRTWLFQLTAPKWLRVTCLTSLGESQPGHVQSCHATISKKTIPHPPPSSGTLLAGKSECRWKFSLERGTTNICPTH